MSALLSDDSALQEARKNRADVRSRIGYDTSGSHNASLGRSNDNHSRAHGDSEDDDLKRALELSRREALADERRRNEIDQEDADLQRAIELSEHEAIQRRMNARDRMEPQLTGDSYNSQYDLFIVLDLNTKWVSKLHYTSLR